MPGGPGSRSGSVCRLDAGPGGPSWPTLFASTFGLAATPSLIPGGNNYAWGGARTGVNGNPQAAPWLDQQVLLYQLSGSQPNAGTLVSIMIGGNDVANNLGDAVALQADELGRVVITSLLHQLHADVTGVGPGKSLANKVTLAQMYYASPDVEATCEVLGGFMNQVRAQSGKKLTEIRATGFRSDAGGIMDAIGCD